MKLLKRIAITFFAVFVAVVIVATVIFMLAMESAVSDLNHEAAPATELTLPFKNLSNGERVDYVAKSNEYFSRGVAPEENMVTVLAQYLQPMDPLKPELKQQLFEELGVEPRTDLPTFKNYKLWLGDRYESMTSAEQRAEDLKYNYAQSFGWTDEELPEMANWLDENMVALDEIKKGSMLPDFYLPLLGEKLIDTTQPYSIPIRDVCRAFTIRANRNRATLEEQQEFEKWLDEIMVVYRIARRFRGPFTLHTVISCSLLGIADASIRQGIYERGLTERQFISLKNQLLNLSSNDEFYQCYCNGEIYWGFEMLQLVADGQSGSLASSLPSVPNLSSEVVDECFFAAASELEKHCRSLARLYEIKDVNLRHQACEQFEAELEVSQQKLTAAKTKTAFLTGTPKQRGVYIGRVVFQLACNAKVHLDAHAYCQTRHALTLVEIDLERFRLRYGRYPSKLDELVPTFCVSKPVDRFARRSFIYHGDQNTFKLYSVGFNGIDENGESSFDLGTDDAWWGEQQSRVPISEFIANDPFANEYR